MEHLDKSTIPQTLAEIRRLLKPSGKGVLIPNIGEDAATSIDQSHVTIKPYSWWRQKITDAGLISRDSISIQIARQLGQWSYFRYIPTLKPGLFIVEDPDKN